MLDSARSCHEDRPEQSCLHCVGAWLGLFCLASHSVYHYLAQFCRWQSKAKRWLAISPLLGSMALIIFTLYYVTTH
ncbi:hypothetical protein [Stenotrophomonas indicatrix]|uniref:hypothetical protein n=1 Tax=Stenotrophomonas indicatrix TaxID=2045451 RepID=UPI001AA1D3BE|nr:hypothetical protein [Stenotrophomonas indicatrix]MBO1748565.1 hypothetical protein [Stenotrophomonas indicatrix]